MNSDLTIIKHLLQENRDEILAKSLLNCHAEGLHSVMLSFNPGAIIRLFFADTNHTLWKNTIKSTDWSIAAHPHHCNVMLVPVMGFTYNLLFSINGEPNLRLNEYLYSSKITGDKGAFQFQRVRGLYCGGSSQLTDDGMHLKASHIHSVFVGEGKRSAWLVLEGREDKDYKPLCWTPKVPTIEPSFYQPMTEAMLHYIERQIL